MLFKKGKEIIYDQEQYCFFKRSEVFFVCLFLEFIFIFYLCVLCVVVYCVHKGPRGGQKELGPLEVELQVLVSCLLWELGTKLGSF